MRGNKLFFLLLFWTMIVAPVLAEITLVIPDTTAYPGDTLSLPMKLSDVSGLEIYSYQFRLKFDPGVVQFIKVDSTKTLTESWGKTWLNTEIAGDIKIGNYGVTALKNSGVLIYLCFKLVGDINDSTRIEILDFEFNAGQPTVQISTGSVAIIHLPVVVRFRSNLQGPVKILIDGLEKKLPFDTSWAYGSGHSIGTISPQYLSSDTRFSFQSWSDGMDITHTVTPVSDTTFVLMMNTEYSLTLKSEYGSVTGAGWYVSGEAATFSVDSLAQQTDTTRYQFVKWLGTGSSSYSGTQRTVTILMNGPVTETAQWALQYYLAIRSNHGTPNGQGWHFQGETITISIDSLVAPIAGTRYIFLSWTGTGSGSYSGAQRKAIVTMSAPIIQQANWRTEHYLAVKSSPTEIVQFKQSGWYAKHSLVSTDKAQDRVVGPTTIYCFQNWMLDQKALPGNPIQVTMDTSHVALAQYQIDSVLVIITTNIGAGSFIILDGIRQPVPFSNWWSYQSEHELSIDSVQLVVDQKTRYLFESWSDQGARTHTVMADTNFQLTATLAIEHLLLIDTHPTGLIQFAETGWYRQGQAVAIPSVPAQLDLGQESLEFKGWYLDRHQIPGTVQQVFMDRPHSLIAAYKDLLFIKGKVTDRRGRLVSDIKVILTGAAIDTVMLSEKGEYAFEMLTEGEYQIAPQRDGFRFEPPTRSFLPLTESLDNQNFVAIDTLKPQVRLLYPNGGERLVAASIDTIKWLATDNLGIDSIAIDLSSDHGQSWFATAKLDGAMASSYLWTVPNLSSDLCQLRIIAKDGDGNQAVDLSDQMFTIVAKSAVGEGNNIQLPATFAVHQNYPNPFNSSTLIRFQLPNAAWVRIKIFNMKGQVIAALVDQHFEAGYHQVSWNGSDLFGHELSSGIYFYQVEAAEQTVMGRMLLLR